MNTTGVASVVLLLCTAFGTFAADLKTKNGNLYGNYKIKKVSGGTVSIAFILPDGSPDIAEIPFDELPDELRAQLPGIRTAPARSAAGNTAAPTPIGFDANLTTLGNNLTVELAKLQPDDRGGRAALAVQTRNLVAQLIPRFAQEADFQFISSDSTGILLKVVGTGQGAAFRSGQYIYLYGAARPAYRNFHQKIYPGGRSITYANYGTMPVYGATEEQAREVALDFLGNYSGDTSLFLPAAAPAQAAENSESAFGNVSVTNIYVEDNRPAWWWGPYYRRHVRPRPVPPTPGPPPRPHPQPGPSMVKPVRPQPKPVPGADQSIVSKNSGHSGNYGLLPDWAIPGGNAKR